MIVVHNREIIKNWITDIEQFLYINEELPEYKTKIGKKRKHKSVFGKVYSAHNSLNGIIDMAMITPLGQYDAIKPIIKDYRRYREF